jgi:hypothetical protein
MCASCLDTLVQWSAFSIAWRIRRRRHTRENFDHCLVTLALGTFPSARHRGMAESLPVLNFPESCSLVDHELSLSHKSPVKRSGVLRPDTGEVKQPQCK